LKKNDISVLNVSTSDLHGGAARAMYRLHKGLISAGIVSKVFVKEKLGDDYTVIPLEAFVPKNKFSKLYAWLLHKIENKKQQFTWAKYPTRKNEFLSDLRSVPVYEALEAIDFNIIHLHWINSRFLDIGELCKINKPIVWTLHDTWAFTGICHYTYKCEKYTDSCGSCIFLDSNDPLDLSHQVWEAKSLAYKNLNLHIVAPSHWLASMVKSSSLLKDFPIKVIPNGLDTKIYSPKIRSELPQNYGLNLNKKVVLFGALNPDQDERKGFTKFLEAVKYLEELNYDFVIATFGSQNAVNIRTKIPIINYGFLARDEQMAQAYSSADVMVVPSLSEVFGQTASEAMSCGTPVVAFDFSGITDIVDHKLNGYLAKPFDSWELAEGIIWCLENNKSGLLSSNARKKALECYSIDSVAEQYIELYKSVLQPDICSQI